MAAAGLVGTRCRLGTPKLDQDNGSSLAALCRSRPNAAFFQISGIGTDIFGM
jgi:hypothetical protein